MKQGRFQLIQKIILILMLAFVIASIGIELHYLLTGSSTCENLELKDCEERKNKYLYSEFRNMLMKIIIDFMNLAVIILNLFLSCILKPSFVKDKIMIIMMLLSVIFSAISLCSGISSIQQDDIYNQEYYQSRQIACTTASQQKQNLELLRQNKHYLDEVQQYNKKQLELIDKACYYIGIYLEAYQQYRDTVVALTIITFLISFIGQLLSIFYQRLPLPQIPHHNLQNQCLKDMKSLQFQLPIVEKEAIIEKNKV